MKSFYEKYQCGQYSQNGEQGIIDECLLRLRRDYGVAVEFGAPTKEYCSNIFHLSKNPDWHLHYFDIDPKEPGITKMEINTGNINNLPKCNIMSLDTDGPDYMLWMALKDKPDIVVIEINSGLNPMQDYFTNKEGASYITMLKLGISKGYFLVCHTGNMIFVRNEFRDRFPEIEGDGISNYQDYFIDKWLIK